MIIVVITVRMEIIKYKLESLLRWNYILTYFKFNILLFHGVLQVSIYRTHEKCVYSEKINWVVHLGFLYFPIYVICQKKKCPYRKFGYYRTIESKMIIIIRTS